MSQIKLGDIVIEVEQKNIKNIHLSVYPPNGRVKVSAPSRMDLDTIRVFAISKLQWIKKQQKVFEKSRSGNTKRIFNKRKPLFSWEKIFVKGY
jgi:predicted metal-dependent hydrolase